MKNILLTGQLIWEALQAESGDFDVLWEALQSQKIQGYITQNDLDTLYRRIAQEQDVGIAFNLVTQLQRVLLIYSPNRSHFIDIEVNNSVYSHSVAVDLNETSVLSLQGFLERYALDMLYANDSLTDGRDGESSLGMQKWYRKWRQSGFDMLWLIPVVLTLALQSMPFFQKVVSDLFDSLEDGLAPQSPEVAQRNRRSEPNSEPSQGERSASPLPQGSPSIPFPRLSSPTPSSADLPTPNPAESPNLTGDIRYPLRNPAPSAPSQSNRPQQSTELAPPQPSPIKPAGGSAIDRANEVQPAVPLTSPPPAQNLPTPEENKPNSNPPNDTPPVRPPENNLFIPIPIFIFPIIPRNGGFEKPFDAPIAPSTEPSAPGNSQPTSPPSDSQPLFPDDSQPTPTAPPSGDIRLDITGDGTMNIPDPLIDPSSIGDPYFPNQSQDQPKSDLPPDAQSSFPDDWVNDPLRVGELSYQSYLPIAPGAEIQAIEGIGVISVGQPWGNPSLNGIEINSGLELNFVF
jgi:hypothetical protein